MVCGDVQAGGLGARNRTDTHTTDAPRQVRSDRVQERRAEKDYTWLFETSMAVARRPAEEYVSHLPPEEQPAAQAGEGQLAASAVEKEPAQPSEARGEPDAPSATRKVRKASQ